MRKLVDKLGLIWKSVKSFFVRNRLVLILWLLLIVIFIVGGLYFEHVKIQTTTIWHLIGLLGGGN